VGPLSDRRCAVRVSGIALVRQRVLAVLRLVVAAGASVMLVLGLALVVLVVVMLVMMPVVVLRSSKRTAAGLTPI
jgi:hypothetical protein